jgi:hypothetical protein
MARTDGFIGLTLAVPVLGSARTLPGITENLTALSGQSNKLCRGTSARIGARESAGGQGKGNPSWSSSSW